MCRGGFSFRPSPLKPRALLRKEPGPFPAGRYPICSIAPGHSSSPFFFFERPRNVRWPHDRLPLGVRPSLGLYPLWLAVPKTWPPRLPIRGGVSSVSRMSVILSRNSWYLLFFPLNDQ